MSKGIILFVNLLILLFFNDVALAPAQRKKKTREAAGNEPLLCSLG